MSSRKVINSIDEHCRDVLLLDDPNKFKPFAGNVILVFGDWKQLLPVVEGARSSVEQLMESFKYSKPADKFESLTLTQNMRIGEKDVSYLQYTEDVGTGYYRPDKKGYCQEATFCPDTQIFNLLKVPTTERRSVDELF